MPLFSGVKGLNPKIWVFALDEKQIMLTLIFPLREALANPFIIVFAPSLTFYGS